MYLYFNFSGYTDVAIGCGRLLGFQLPENFNRPFAARNLLDFWARAGNDVADSSGCVIFISHSWSWRQTGGGTGQGLGETPRLCSAWLVAVRCRRLARPDGRLCPVLGLINGLGVAVNQAYADALRAWLSKPALRRYQQNRLIHGIGVVLTYHFVCFAFMIFAVDFGKFVTVWQEIGRQLAEFTLPDFSFLRRGDIFVVAMLCLLWLVAKNVFAYFFPAEGGESLARPTSDGIPSLARRANVMLYSMVFVQTALVMLLFVSLWALGKSDPDVVYRRF